jgi:serine beta-lactamase-like protein LACTB
MTHTYRILTVLVSLAFVQSAAAASPAGPTLSKEQQERIENVISTGMTRGWDPSTSVAVALDNKLVWSAAYGMADVENHVPATSQTLYRTASIDKWLTATAAMRLVEEGKLDLDASPQSYCKAYPMKQWPMKVRHLLNHTAGVRHYWDDAREFLKEQPKLVSKTWQRYVEKNPLDALQLREEQREFTRYTDRGSAVAPFRDDPLLYAPGTMHRYTSHGYRLLGCVLEGAAGESYTKLMRRLVFDPAHMTQTTPDDAWAVVPNRAALYSYANAGGDPVLEEGLVRAKFRDVSENLPAGGHLSTAAELIQFAVAFNTGRLVSADSMRQMLAKQDVTFEAESGSYYGFGINVREVPENTDHPQWQPMKGLTVLSHSGGQAGTSTQLMLLPSRGIAVAYMINRDEAGGGSLTRAIMAEVLKP